MLLANLVPRQPGHLFPEIVLLQSLINGDFEPASSRDDLRRLQRPRQWTRVNRGNRLSVEANRQRRRLPPAEVRQRVLGPALESELEVALGLGMTDKQQTHYAATLTVRPQFAHVQRSYVFFGHPADSLWKIQTSGAANTVSTSHRGVDFSRVSVDQSTSPHLRQGGTLPATGTHVAERL